MIWLPAGVLITYGMCHDAGLEVYLDAAAAQRLKKAAPPPAQFKPDGLPKEATHAGSADDMLNPEEVTTSPSFGDCAWLPCVLVMPCSSAQPCLLGAMQARAAILVRLSTLVAGSSGVRLAVIEALVGLLRERQAPQLPVCMHAEELQGQLAKILVSEAGPLSEGVHFCTHNADLIPPVQCQPLSTYIGQATTANTHMRPCYHAGLSAQERAALEAGQSSAAGVAALQVGQGGSVLFTATIAAALTCEALGAQVNPPWKAPVLQGTFSVLDILVSQQCMQQLSLR